MDIPTFLNKLDKVEPAFEAEFKARVEERTPVSKSDEGDVGLLKRSWEWQDENGVRSLVNTAINHEGKAYAVYIEFGTWKIQPHMMLGTTIVEANDILTTALAQVEL